MFNVNDYVVYGSEGVCMVESIGHPDVRGLDELKEYYTLLPNSRSGKIYTPVDSAIRMRHVITKEKADELISSISGIAPQLDVPKDTKLATNYYRRLVRTYECETLLRIIKYVRGLQKQFAVIKRNVPAVDMKYLRMAEEMLYCELSFALDKSVSEIRDVVISLCDAECADDAERCD